MAWGVAGVTLLLGAAAFALAAVNGGLTSQTGFMAPFLTVPPIAGLLAARRPQNVVGWLLLACAAHIVGYAFLQQYGLYALVTDPGALPFAAELAWLRVTMWVPAAAIVLVFLPLLFPTGSTVTPRWRLVGWVAGSAALAVVAVGQVVAWPLRGPTLLDEAEAWTHGTVVDTVTGAGFVTLLLCSSAAIASLVVRYRRGSRVEQAQVKGVLVAVAAFVVALVASGFAPDSPITSALPSLVLPLVPVAIALAVLRYRLYDIDRIVSRTLSYAVVTAVLAGVYAVGVLGVGAMVPGGSSDLVVASSTLAVAALFQPVRRQVQAVVDLRFNRRDYDAQLTVSAFASRLRDQVDLDGVTDDLGAALHRTVAPRQASLWLREVPA